MHADAFHNEGFGERFEAMAGSTAVGGESSLIDSHKQFAKWRWPY